MTWTLVIWSMLGAACLTLAAIHLPVWLRNRAAWPNLFFSVLCIATAGLVLCEALLMRARTPAEYAATGRWLHVAIWLVLVFMVAFVAVYLDAGRRWLAWTAVGLRTVALVANFTTGENLNFLEVRKLAQIEFLGDLVSIAEGVSNPWMAVGALGLWCCFFFIADATMTAWRRGAKGRALRIGGSCLFVLLASALQGGLIVWAGMQSPVTSGLLFFPVVAVMAYELSGDLFRTSQLVADLGESEQRMMLAAGAANLGVWSRDMSQDETWANSQWRNLLGFEGDEPVTTERLLEKVHPDDRQRLRRTMAETERAPGLHQIEFRVLRPDDQVRWISSLGQAEFDRHGRAVRSRGASMDCTARKDAEQETLLLRQEIAHVGRVSVVGQLASALAHEINQPLGAILRNAEAAAMFLQQEKPDLEEIRAILEDIRRDDQRAGAVIDRMRSLLRRQDVEKRPLEVDELFDDVAALLRPEAMARSVKLSVQIDGEVPRVAGDRIHLQQVLLNLVSNGMDAIDASVRDARDIVVTARNDGAQCVEIAVADSGNGIKADHAAQLFEPFFTTKPKGMGMGLAISRTIIEAHGGRLWAENGAGGGARFLFTVPIAGEMRS
jgi:two-component system, LuxR family, sensor kinase FixL